VRNLDRRLRPSVVLLIACFGVGITTVSADPPPPAYLTTRSGQTDPESITADEALWAAFVGISGLEDRTPGAGLKLLQHLGLSPAESETIQGHIKTSIAEANTYSQEVSLALCAERAGIQTSRDLYAQALQDMDAKEASRQAALIAKLSDVISPDGKDIFYTWATQQLRSHMTIVSTDHVMRIAMENIDPAVEIERFCSALREPKAPTRVQKEVRNGVTITRITR
jgi:hypothetical protein